MVCGREKILKEKGTHKKNKMSDYYGKGYAAIAQVRWKTPDGRVMQCLLKREGAKVLRIEDLTASGSSPLIISMVGGGTDTTHPIKISEAKLSVQNFTAFETLKLHAAGDRTHALEVYMDSVLIWQGFMVPDSWFEPFVFTPYETTFSFVDGLSVLKDTLFVGDDGKYLRGRTRAFNVIDTCLRKIGIKRNFVDQINILSYDTPSLERQKGTLAQRIIDLESCKGLSCWSVLELFCTSTMSRIEYRPVENKYYIRRIDNVDDEVWSCEYDMDVWDSVMGSIIFAGKRNNWTEVTPGSLESGRLCWQENSQKLERIAGWNKCKFRQLYGKKPSIFPYHSFEDDDWIDDNTLKFWQSNGIRKAIVNKSNCVEFLGFPIGRSSTPPPYQGNAFIQTSSSMDFYTGEGMRFAATNAWKIETAYAENDRVFYPDDSAHYYAKRNNTGMQPDISLDDWEYYEPDDPDLFVVDVTIRNESHEEPVLGTYYGPRTNNTNTRINAPQAENKRSVASGEDVETWFEQIGVADWFRVPAQAEIGLQEASNKVPITADGAYFKILKENFNDLGVILKNGMKLIFTEPNNLPTDLETYDGKTGGFVYSMTAGYLTPSGNWNFKLRREWPANVNGFVLEARTEDVDKTFQGLLYFSFVPLKLWMEPVTGVYYRGLPVSGQWNRTASVETTGNLNMHIASTDLQARNFIGFGTTARYGAPVGDSLNRLRLRVGKISYSAWEPGTGLEYKESGGIVHIESVRVYIKDVPDGNVYESVFNPDNKQNGAVDIFWADTPIKGNFRNNNLKFYNNLYCHSIEVAPSTQFFYTGAGALPAYHARMMKLIELFYLKLYRYPRIGISGILNSTGVNPMPLVLQEKHTKKRYIAMSMNWDVTLNTFSGKWHEIGDAVEYAVPRSFSKAFSRAFS